MKAIHPKTTKVTVKCACGEILRQHPRRIAFMLIFVRSVIRSIPQAEVVDAGGRVDKFRKRMENK